MKQAVGNANRQAGATLLVGLLLLLALSIIALSSVTGGAPGGRAAVHAQSAEHAFQLAESAADLALAERHFTSDPAGASIAPIAVIDAAGVVVGSFEATTRFQETGAPPHGGFSLGNDGFAACFFRVVATGRAAGGTTSTHMQDFYVICPAGAPARTAVNPFNRTRHLDGLRTAQPSGDAPERDRPRRLYTDIAGARLTSAGNAVVPGNPAITAALIGSPETLRAAVLQRARRPHPPENAVAIGQPLMSSQPSAAAATVVYGGTAARPDATVFARTGDGHLRAVDASDGTELWTFIPGALLPRLHEVYGTAASSPRPLDRQASLRVYVHEDDDVPGIDASAGERVLLYFGSGDGADTLYALEVTDRANPRLLWRLHGRDAGFEALGQVRSAPVIAKVRIGTTLRTVAIFGGGYDEQRYGPEQYAGIHGNALFMVDALSGELLWSAGSHPGHALELPAMRKPLAAAVRVLDIDQDGTAERMYAVDTGGGLWRFDIVNGATGAGLVQGGLLAALGAGDPAAPGGVDARRFLAGPDVALVTTGERPFLNISIGSGDHRSMQDTNSADEFYTVRDFNVFTLLNAADYGAPITPADLSDVTDLASPLPAHAKGWRLPLPPGEKVTAESLTFHDVIYFATFQPARADASCPATSCSRLYAVSALDGSPRARAHGPAHALNPGSRSRPIPHQGPAPAPVVLFLSPALLCIATDCEPLAFDNAPVRTRWAQSGIEQPSVPWRDTHRDGGTRLASRPGL